MGLRGRATTINTTPAAAELDCSPTAVYTNDTYERVSGMSSAIAQVATYSFVSVSETVTAPQHSTNNNNCRGLVALVAADML